MYCRWMDEHIRVLTELYGTRPLTTGSAHDHLAESAGGNDSISLRDSEDFTRQTLKGRFTYSGATLHPACTSGADISRERKQAVAQVGASEGVVRRPQQLENQPIAAMLRLADEPALGRRNMSAHQATHQQSVAPSRSTVSRSFSTVSNQGIQGAVGQHAVEYSRQDNRQKGRAFIQQALPADKKVVHWAPTATVVGTPGRGILRRFGYGQVWTLPFSVHFIICAQKYTVLFEPLQSHKADIDTFEYELTKRVATEHKDSLRAFMGYQEYSLSFDRAGRTSTIVIPITDKALRNAAFKTFLNGVPKGALVTLD
jgi:hypothetical protein